MSQESLQTSILAAVAVVLLLQTIMLAAVLVFIVRALKPFERLIASACETLQIMKRGAERLEFAVAQIERTVQNRMQHADSLAREVVETGYTQAIAAEKLISRLLGTLQKAIAEIERTLNRFFREGRALNAGVRTAIGTLFSRGR